jgi:hypothetical protein
MDNGDGDEENESACLGPVGPPQNAIPTHFPSFLPKGIKKMGTPLQCSLKITSEAK